MVGYKKDKTIVDEQELRRLQHLSFIEHHREDAARLPAEAAARLVDASYTLCKLLIIKKTIRNKLFLQLVMFKVLQKS